MRVHPVTLEGEFVRLEPLLPEHSEALWPAAFEREIWRYMTSDVASPDDLRAWIHARRRGLADGTALPFLQRDPRTGEAFGSTSLFDIDAAHKRLEIGFTWVGLGRRRSGANTEAKLLLLEHAFERLGANRVQLKTDVRNERSWRAMERLGATREGVLRAHMVLPDGHVRDTVVYSVVRSEWPGVRERLRGLLRPRAP